MASESGAIVEGTSPDKPSTFNDADASQFNVTKVLKAIPGVNPAGAIEIVFAPPNSGDFLPAGKYLLFVEYNAIGNDYSIASSSFENVLTVGEFLINGAAATEKRCSTPVSDGTPATAVASTNAAASAPPLSASQFEGYARQLTIGNAPGVVATGITISAQTTELHLGGSDRVTFGPPPPGTKPAITYATAVAAASGYAPYPEQFAAGLEIVRYGDFTDLDARHDYGNGSYGPPIYNHVLAVDIRFVNIPLPVIGGPAASEPESPQPPIVAIGDVDILINAITGEPITEIDQGTS